MKKLIAECIERIYKKKDYDYYLAKCKDKVTLNIETIYILKKYGFEYKQIENDFWPSASFTILFGSFSKGDFKIVYKGQLIFSKLIPLYSLEFSYDIKNQDPDGYSPNFYETGEEPLTVKQANFSDEFIEKLKALGYKRIYKKDQDFTISGFEYESPNSFFNGKVDLWTALTHDVLNKIDD